MSHSSHNLLLNLDSVLWIFQEFVDFLLDEWWNGNNTTILLSKRWYKFWVTDHFKMNHLPTVNAPLDFSYSIWHFCFPQIKSVSRCPLIICSDKKYMHEACRKMPPVEMEKERKIQLGEVLDNDTYWSFSTKREILGTVLSIATL